MSNPILLISSKPEDAVFATEVATAIGLPLEIAQNVNDASQIIANKEPRIILTDTSSVMAYQVFEDMIQETVGLFSDKIDPNSIYFLSSEDPEILQYLVQSPLFGHFVFRKQEDPKEAGQYYSRIIKSTLDGHAFGLEKFLKPGTKIQSVKLQNSTQKQGAIDAIKNYLLAAKFQGRMATVMAGAVDELVMNAIFDAPVDSIGRPLYVNVSRSTVLKLEGKSVVELQIGFDGKYAGVTAIDHFGSLDKSKLLSHISRTYSEDEYKVKHASAGAGIGLSTVFRSGGSFIFVSESRSRTEVTVLFRRADSFVEFKDQFRFISTQFYF